MTADYYVLLPTFYNSSAILIYYSTSSMLQLIFYASHVIFFVAISKIWDDRLIYIVVANSSALKKSFHCVFIYFFLQVSGFDFPLCFFGYRFCTFLGLPAWCYKHPKCKQTAGCFSSLDGLKFPLDWGLVIFHWCFCSPPCYDLCKTNILSKQC